MAGKRKTKIDFAVLMAIGFYKYRKLWELVKDYIFPKECFGCGEEGEYLCSACFNKIKFFDRLNCGLCNKADIPTGICQSCRHKSGIDQIITATSYNYGVVNVLVESFKYHYIEEINIILAKIMELQIKRLDFSSLLYNKAIIPIPLHKKRLLERGFNQAEKLGKALSEKFHCQLEVELLTREKKTAQQAKLSREERLLNMVDAFAPHVTKKIPEAVVLIDDVLTSGATMCAAAKCLKNIGVKNIICLTVCHG